MLSAIMQIGKLLTKLRPGLRDALQEPKFTSDKNRSFGFVLCAAGPVAPSTCEVTRTKVA